MSSYDLRYVKDNQTCVLRVSRIVEREYAPYFESAVCIIENMQSRLDLYDSLSPTGSRPIKVVDQYRDSDGFHVVQAFLRELDEDWITIYREGSWICWVRKSKYNELPEKLRRRLKESWGLLKVIKDFIPFF